MLPEKVPNARILTYGYNSSTKNISEGQNVLDIALQLIVNLKDYRREKAEKHRDIVLVCHSLGGIIAKKAILLHQSSEEGKAIRKSIVGIIFMGTPHCGSDLANIGSAFASIASMVVDMPRLLLKTLSKNSSALYDISREFATVTSDLNLKLISFYELNPCSPPWWKGKSVVVVDKRSAILGLPGEEIVAAHANHREICRFRGDEDPAFRPVWTRIDDFAAEAARKARLQEDVSKRMMLLLLPISRCLSDPSREQDLQPQSTRDCSRGSSRSDPYANQNPCEPQQTLEGSILPLLLIHRPACAFAANPGLFRNPQHRVSKALCYLWTGRRW